MESLSLKDGPAALDESRDTIESVGDLPRFVAPKMLHNEAGWGPVGIPEQFQNVLYQQFNKGDKIGKVADWTGTERYYQDRRYGRDRYQQQYNSGAVGTQYAYYHQDDDATFQLVDTSRPQKTMMQRANRMKQITYMRKMVQRERERRAAAGYANQSTKATKGIAKERNLQMKRMQRRGGGGFGFRGGRGGGRFGEQRQLKLRPQTVAVQPDWEVIDEVEFARLHKLKLSVENGEDIPDEQYGTLYYYDRSYDRATPRAERPLLRCDGHFFTVTTTEDPVIQRLAKLNAGNVFGTDVLLATLMCTTRSVYGWDVVAHRVGDKLFFDKRATKNSINAIDALTVSETAPTPPEDEDKTINSPRNLSSEALYVNQNFRLGVLRKDGECVKLTHPIIPFVDPDDSSIETNVAYKYRVFDLGTTPEGKEVRVVCRTEHDAVTTSANGETQFMTIKAFNEWDSRSCGGVDWRSKLESQKGAVLATEFKNNNCKLAKWAVQALLADSDVVKIGYVSRVHVRDSTKHVTLGTQQFSPYEFAQNINLNLNNSWGILRWIIEALLSKEPGKYLIMKDANKPSINIYQLPSKEFESDSDASSAAEEEEEPDDLEDGDNGN